MRPGIAVSQPIDTHLNASAPCAIFERVDPLSIDLGHLHAHAHSVAQGIRMSSGTSFWLGPNVCDQRRRAGCRECKSRDARRSPLDRSVMLLAVQLGELAEEA